MTFNTALNAHMRLLKEVRLRCLGGKFRVKQKLNLISFYNKKIYIYKYLLELRFGNMLVRITSIQTCLLVSSFFFL